MDNYLSCHITETRFGNSWRRGIGSIVGWLAALVLLLLFVFPSPTMAAAVIPDPEPGLYVLDQAGVMSNETKAMIINTSQELARQTKAQVAVVTMKTLDGQPIADVALEIGRKWQLGDKQLNNGIVILVVPTEKKIRIEVGYGLEGALPDGKIGRLEDEYMLPAFKEGNYDLGLANGYKAIVAEVAKEYGVSIGIQQGTKTVPVEAPAQKKVPTWLTILGAIGLIFLIWLDNRFLNGFFLGMLLGMLFRGGGRGGGGGFGGGDSGGGGSFGGGGSSRDW
ncbi:MAG: methanol dehydrogenase [Firmicutes bacterium HGW-Firmicutes-15]|nr:MAG: methanol dehydrogenase [Firmicutes bacterium HGW-Firmicutes-15]